jgi:tRNA 2-thiouridine synthesizing protein E
MNEDQERPQSMYEVMHPGDPSRKNPDFPHAPEGWEPANAEAIARQEELELSDDHWEVVNALQEYFARHEEKHVDLRELHDALDESFHAKGGIKYLYSLFPGGPVAQGCRLAGLEVPPGAVVPGFGSVV